MIQGKSLGETKNPKKTVHLYFKVQLSFQHLGAGPPPVISSVVIVLVVLWTQQLGDLVACVYTVLNTVPQTER